MLVCASNQINLRANTGAMQRLLPPLTFTPEQFDFILAHSGYFEEIAQSDIKGYSGRLTNCAYCGDVSQSHRLVQCRKCCRVIHSFCILEGKHHGTLLKQEEKGDDDDLDDDDDEERLSLAEASTIEWLCNLCEQSDAKTTQSFASVFASK